MSMKGGKRRSMSGRRMTGRSRRWRRLRGRFMKRGV
jgi:hypothetical protein